MEVKPDYSEKWRSKYSNLYPEMSNARDFFHCFNGIIFEINDGHVAEIQEDLKDKHKDLSKSLAMSNLSSHKIPDCSKSGITPFNLNCGQFDKIKAIDRFGNVNLSQHPDLAAVSGNVAERKTIRDVVLLSPRLDDIPVHLKSSSSL